MYKFKVGDRIFPTNEDNLNVVYTIRAIGELLDDGDQGAWVTSENGNNFGSIVNLKFMKPYFEPGFFQWRGWDGRDMKGPIKWHETIFGITQEKLDSGTYVRVDVIPVEEKIEDDV